MSHYVCASLMALSLGLLCAATAPRVLVSVDAKEGCEVPQEQLEIGGAYRMDCEEDNRAQVPGSLTITGEEQGQTMAYGNGQCYSLLEGAHGLAGGGQRE